MKRNYVCRQGAYLEAPADLDYVYTQEIHMLNQAWGLYGFSIETLLRQYRLDQPNLPPLSDVLSVNCGENGLFLHDTSGLATHMLGLYFLHAWHQGEILQDYEQVFWLPFTQLKKLPHQPSKDSPATMEGLASMMHPKIAYHPAKKTLVLITGIDYLSYDKFMGDEDFKLLADAWHTLITTQHWIGIGNCVPDIFKANTTREIALPPTFLNLMYGIADSDTVKIVAYPGTLLVHDIERKTSETFRFDLDEPNGVFTMSKQTLQAYMQGKIEQAIDTHEEVRHDQPLLSSQEVLKFLAGEPLGQINLKVPVLDTPAKWHYAARSAARIHEAQSRKKFYLYQVGGYLIVRRMIGNSVNYISSLGEASQHDLCSQKVVALSEKKLPEEIQIILSKVLATEDFDTLNDVQLGRALRRAKSEWIKQNRGQQLPSDVDIIFKKISDLFKNNLTDSQIDDSLKQQPEENIDASYQELQYQLNTAYQAIQGTTTDKDHYIETCLTDITKGRPINPQFKFLSLLLAANLLSETARAAFTFFAPYAMLQIMRNNNLVELQGYWQRFLALPQRIQIPQDALSDWRVAVRADCLDALGGIHPMAHNGSFRQVSPESVSDSRAKRSQYGILWPDLKAQILYGLWLVSSLQAKTLGIKLKQWQFTLQPKRGHALLKEEDSYQILCDFELLQRLQATYAQDDQHQNIFAMYQRPFKEEGHLIAHPDRITLMPCEGGTYGYLLAIAHQNQSEPHFVHLDWQQAHMIAVKMNASGNESNALLLLNYLCTRHSKNLAFRMERALHLVFRTDYITDSTMRNVAHEDITFLKQYFNLPEDYKTQVFYIETIAQLRQSLEGVYHDPSCSNELKGAALFRAATYAEKTIKKFAESDEEYSILHLMLSNAYLKLTACAKKLDPSQYPDFLQRSVWFYSQSSNHFITYTLARRHNSSDAFATHVLTEIFHQMMEYSASALELITLCGSPPALRKENRHFIESKQKKSKFMIFINAIKLCIENFSPFMGKQRKNLQLLVQQVAIEKPTAPKAMKLFFNRVENYLVSLDSSKNYEIHLITHNRQSVILIKLNWEVPTALLLHWLTSHLFNPQLVGDQKKGICLYIPIEEQKISKRGELQPIFHPDAFLVTAHHYISSEEEPYFLAFQTFFNSCVEKIKEWSIFSEKRISYYLFSVQPELPSLILIQKDNNIQDILIRLPPGIPVDVISDWLCEKDFAFHWANDQNYGRCFCVTAINVTSSHAMYNPATSNAHLVERYLPKITQEKISEVLSDDQSDDASDEETDDEITKLLEKAQSDQRQGNYLEAIHSFEDLMKLEPNVQADYHNCACTYFCLGMQNKNKQHFSLANELFKKAIELDPAALNTQVEYANFLYKMKKYDACLGLVDEVLKRPLVVAHEDDILLYHRGEKNILPEVLGIFFNENEDESAQLEIFHPQILAYYLKILCLKKAPSIFQEGIERVLCEFKMAVDSLGEFFKTTSCAGVLYYKLLSNAYLIGGYQESANYFFRQSEEYEASQVTASHGRMPVSSGAMGV